jgi:hypothetical protein
VLYYDNKDKLNATILYQCFIYSHVLQNHINLFQFIIIMTHLKMTTKSNSILQTTCNNCTSETNLKTCVKCKFVKYCSKECQINDWTEHKKVCSLYSNKKNLKAFNELFEYNIFDEYNALLKILSEPEPKNNKYVKARFNMLKYVIKSIKNDPIQGDYWDDECDILLKDAGKLLYEYNSMEGMHDKLAWSFIPRRYHRNIDYAWSGIGTWLA